MWITTELKPSLKGMEQFSAITEGVALEFSTNQNGMDIHFVATNFSKSVDAKLFNIAVPEGFTEMTEEEIKSIPVVQVERELTTQEKIQKYIPFAVMGVAVLFLIALLMPSKKDKQSNKKSGGSDDESKTN